MTGTFIKFMMIIGCMLVIWPGTAAAGGGQVSLTFLAVGNYAGQLKENAAASRPGVSRFAAAFKQQRQQVEGGLLFVSTGNMLAGTPESELTEGMAVISVFNDLHLDVMSIGSGDLKWPEKLLPKQAAAARYAYLGLSPIISADNKRTLSVPYKLVKRGGVRVGFLGVNKRDFSDGILSSDNVLAGAEKLQTYITELHNEEADFIVLVTDIASADMIKTILDNLTGINMVIADTAASADRIGSTILLGAGQGGSQLSRADITFDKDSLQITDTKLSHYDIGMAADTDTVYNIFLERVDAKVSFLKQQPAGRTENELWHNPGGTSLLAQFAADEVQKAAAADTALIFGGEIGGSIKKGGITQGDLYRAFSDENEVVVADISGQNLQKLLSDGLTSNVNGVIMFSGLRVVYDDNKLGERKTAVTLADGSALDGSRLYKAALSRQVYLRYKNLLAGDAAEFTGRSWRSYVAAALQEAAIAVTDDQRLVIIPYAGGYDFP